MSKDVILAGDLILIPEDNASVMNESLVYISEIIENYCNEPVRIFLSWTGTARVVRFLLSRNRYLEFELHEQSARVNGSKNYYRVLQLRKLSHTSRNSLVVRIMFDVFNWS
ncbi:MAG: hypothetical protein IJZ00_02970 [Lachnospiraceae bacterium]|nr:hypothetical protein [Lachnospiraceae bacterium]